MHILGHGASKMEDLVVVVVRHSLPSDRELATLGLEELFELSVYLFGVEFEA